MMGAAQSARSTFSCTFIDYSLSSSLSTFKRSANGTSHGQQNFGVTLSSSTILADTPLIVPSSF